MRVRGAVTALDALCPPLPDPSQPPCLCLDIETARHDRLELREVGAWRSDTGAQLHLKGPAPPWGARLDALSAGAQALLGHNISAFDRPTLAALLPELALHGLPQIDTLTLSPIAYPQNPYHRLVKDYKLCSTSRNDPVRDAQLAWTLFQEQCQALQERVRAHPAEAECLHFLLTSAQDSTAATATATPIPIPIPIPTPTSGMGALWAAWRQAPRPELGKAQIAWVKSTAHKGCSVAQRRLVLEWLPDPSWHLPLAYVLAWLRVAGGNSVLPPWVAHAHPRTRQAIRALRDTPCNNPTCQWCREQHQLEVLLPRFFPGITGFRATPATPDGGSLQRTIVEHGMAGTPTLAILPTGGGKSLCYQLPALAHFFRTGVLTVVISPLQSLMKDQVDGLRDKHGVTCAGYLNGQLTPLERRDMLERLRLGDLGLIFVAPEQLRSKAFTQALAHREIRAWVFDEAHCLSKWGHDFRPDYLYVARCIRRMQSAQPAPVFCFTATAKPEVVQDICQHFAQELGMELACLEGGVERSNLHYEAHAVPRAGKYAAALRLLQESLRDGGGAIVFCARQKTVEEVAEFLQGAGLRCAHFHGGMPGEEKRAIQEAFISGALEVIAATNAFGMGVDKPDVRLVVHLDTPGSLENYLQEAGRAGRDQQPARCVLLYDETDLDVQFRLLRNSRLTQGDIQSILRALRTIKERDRTEDEVVASTGEILRQSPDKQRIDPDARDADTKVRIAISWLEEAHILQRHENHTSVFPGSLLVGDLEQARERLHSKLGAQANIAPYLAILGALLNTEDDESLSTDELMGITGLDARTVGAMLRELDRWKLLSNDAQLGVLFFKEPSTAQRLEELMLLENALMARLREAAPDADAHTWQTLNTRILCDVLRRDTRLELDPQRLGRLLVSFAAPFGRDDVKAGVHGFFQMRPDGHDRRQVRVLRSWQNIEVIRARRMQLAQALVAIFHRLRKHNNQLSTCKQGELEQLLQGDAALASLDIQNWDVALSAALLYLDANEVLHLARGKAVFRSAMRIQFNAQASRRQFNKTDYAELKLHYEDKTVQIHVMAEYAKLALQKIQDAMRFILDYFSLSKQEFVRRHFAGRQDILQLATTEAAHRKILVDLGNPAQQAIVAAPPEGSQLVLAGPGSGKTRVIVHRVAWLLRQCMVHPEEILVLTYNRSAAAEIRNRLWQLVGADAAGVAVQTLHSLAMRLTGTSYTVALECLEHIDFDAVIRQARALLQRASEPEDEHSNVSTARDKLLAGLRFVLVDEYQDINGEHYQFISALAGRTLASAEDRLSLMAVGDDDQNIYEFSGANVRYIRQFESDYQAQRFSLLENYRSSAHIIDSANNVIAHARQRMKQEQALCIDHARRDHPPGGVWETKDPVLRGRVHILEVPAHPLQAAALALAELQRLYALRADTQEAGRWGHFAVLAREHDDLDALYHLCRQHGVAVRRLPKNDRNHAASNQEESIALHTSREGSDLLTLLRGHRRGISRPRMVLHAHSLGRWLQRKYGPAAHSWNGNPYVAALAQFIAQVQPAQADNELVVEDVIEELYQFKLNTAPSGPPRPNAPLLLLTAHSAKGLEFDHVLILDNGNWQRSNDAERRLFYVAMTRARQTLTVCHTPTPNTGQGQGHAFVHDLQTVALRTQPAPPPATDAPILRYETPGLNQVYLSWAGKLAPTHPVHRAIAALQVGDSLMLRLSHGRRPRWQLMDKHGTQVGAMATAFLPAPNVQAVTVAAIHVRQANANDREQGVQCSHWEVVVPCLEVVASTRH